MNGYPARPARTSQAEPPSTEEIYRGGLFNCRGERVILRLCKQGMEPAIAIRDHRDGRADSSPLLIFRDHAPAWLEIVRAAREGRDCSRAISLDGGWRLALTAHWKGLVRWQRETPEGDAFRFPRTASGDELEALEGALKTLIY